MQTWGVHFLGNDFLERQVHAERKYRPRLRSSNLETTQVGTDRIVVIKAMCQQPENFHSVLSPGYWGTSVIQRLRTQVLVPDTPGLSPGFFHFLAVSPWASVLDLDL